MRICALQIVYFLAAFYAGIAAAEDRIGFNLHIRPILSDRCVQCHGPDEKQREAGFRLDIRDSAIGEAESGLPPIVPGKPGESELFRRMSTSDEFEQMPPPQANKPGLSEAELALISKWIEQGAEYEPHWAFVSPQRPELPQVKHEAWIKNPIDHFVLEKLEARGWQPSEEAGKRTLIRRVTLDLTGLPPTPEEVEAFVSDDSPNAYEKIVDRLLASPRYGERMAWPWLDAARYADTNGYQGDPVRTMWPWRDWVVGALNENMPFDKFTIEQLAGDQLPNPTNAQIMATGFNRNHMHNGEGGRIAEETRVENVFDRTETTATVWMGLTYTCARCHTHKFDPITHAEYFALYDFFNQTSEAGGIRGGAVEPFALYMPPSVQVQIADIDKQIADIEQRILAADAEAAAAQAAWESRIARSGWEVLVPQTAETNSESKLVPLGDGSLRAEGPVPDKDVYTIVANTNRIGLTAIRLETLTDEVASPANSNGRANNGNMVLSEFEAYVRPLHDPTAEFQQLKIVRGTAEHSQASHPIERAFDGTNDGSGNGWATEGFRRKQSNKADFFIDKPFGFKAGTEIKLVLRCESQHLTHIIARPRLSVGQGDAQDVLEPEQRVILNKRPGERSETETAKLSLVFRSKAYEGEAADAAGYRALANEIEKLKEKQSQLREQRSDVKVMVMDTLVKPRQTRILETGLYDQPIGDAITADIPSVLPPLPEGALRNRLTLARWLVSPEHPLTARVTVNRYWELFFGSGLVTTSDDFGTQGKPPTHPELLDWLATEFVASGWDVKHMHRLIVTSATYRQVSVVDEMLLEHDPANQLLARQSRFRLPSWMIRDQALALSGLSKLQLGGPPVKPYQPDGVWSEATFGKIKYQRDSGDALYRRSLYVFWRRIVGPTMFFDVANRQTCSVSTPRTNTPLHALTTLNDVTYVEAARGLATRVLRENKDDSERIRQLFALLTSRDPEERELAIVLERLEKLRVEFAEDPDSANKLLAIGEAPRDESLSVVELASYTALSNILLNLDEALNRP